MELTKSPEAAERRRVVYEYSETVETAVETVVPDSMPDFGRVLLASGSVVLRSKDARAGEVSISGGVSAIALCAPEEGPGVRALTAALPLAFRRESPEIPEDCYPVATLTLLSLEGRLLNPRKLLLRGSVQVRVECYARCGGVMEGPEAPPEGLETLWGEFEHDPVALAREKTFVLADEFHAPADAPLGELLGHTVELRENGVRSVGSRLIVSGEARLLLLYLTPEGELREGLQVMGYSQMLDAEREPESPDATVTTLLTAAYVERSGAEGVVTIELHLAAQVVCTERESVRALLDCYSNRRELALRREERTLRSVSRRLRLRASATETVSALPAAVEIRHVCCRPVETSAEPGGARAVFAVTAVYEAEDGCAYSAGRRVSVSFAVPLAEGETLRFLRGVAAEASAAAGPQGVALSVTAELEALVCCERAVECVAAVEQGAERDLSNSPSLTILRPERGDTLWSLAGACRSTRELIMLANGMEDAESLPDILLIPTDRA